MEIIGIYEPSMYMHVGDSYEKDVLGAMASKWNSVLIWSKSIPSSYMICPPSIIVNSIQQLYELFSDVFSSSDI